MVLKRIERNAVFEGPRLDLVNQNYFDDLQVALPVHVGLTDSDGAQLIAAVRAGWWHPLSGPRY